MKTIEQWFNELKEPLRTEALEAFHNSPNFENWRDTKFEDPMNAIRWAFKMTDHGGNERWYQIGNNWELHKVDLLERHYNEIPGNVRTEFNQKAELIWNKQHKQLKAGTRKTMHYSARTILHVIRWETDIHSGTQFKVDDHWSPVLARMFERSNPKYLGFFEKRKSEKYD